jgi:hypothetical protein
MPQSRDPGSIFRVCSIFEKKYNFGACLETVNNKTVLQRITVRTKGASLMLNDLHFEVHTKVYEFSCVTILKLLE